MFETFELGYANCNVVQCCFDVLFLSSMFLKGVGNILTLGHNKNLASCLGHIRSSTKRRKRGKIESSALGLEPRFTNELLDGRIIKEAIRK